MIKETFYKAFFDLLQERINNDPVDVEWLCKLYTEIKEKLCNLSKKKRKEIEEHLDVELFRQMIEHKVFDGQNLCNLINFIFDKIIELASPGRDEENNKMRQEILDTLYANKSFGEIVCLLIKNANMCIDNIYLDIENIEKTGSK